MSSDFQDADLNGESDATSSIIPLQSKEHEEILNVIDQLRLEGVSRYVDLPQLIVCGDQSSGKSSVLEAISGLAFPAKDNLCTRFATELILRRSPETGVATSIQPDSDRSEAEQAQLRNASFPKVALKDFQATVSAAERLIGTGTNGSQFSKDVLRVEVSGPSQPHLTMVDLPGLYHAPDESQSEAGVEFVESLVLSYIRNPRSVILTVVSAKSDIALQKVTSFTQKCDPVGSRTLGVITKPDRLDKTSDMERSFLELAKNRRVNYKLGWHVLKNRDHNERHLSLEGRRESELRFLRQGIWASLDSSQVGVDALRSRLSEVLRNHIVRQLPSLIAETEEAYRDTDGQLRRMGDSRKTPAEQRRYLFSASEKFTALLSHAVNGTYSDPAFGDAMDDDGYHRRLRAVVQNELADFSATLLRHGERWHIVDDGLDDDEVPEGSIRHSAFIDEVLQRMRRSRGRELLGMFNPLIVGDLFYLQAQPWEKLVTACIDTVIDAVQRTLHLLVMDTLDTRTGSQVITVLINPELEKLEILLRAKAHELLGPQKSGHPITYNHYFTETVQKARQRNLRNHILEQLQERFGVKTPGTHTYSFDIDLLADALSEQSEADTERFACSEAIDYMTAYYKVARKKFVDDFSILAVEKCLLEPITRIFCAQTVETQTEASVHIIAAEDDASRQERARLEAKRDALKQSLDQLHRLDRHNFSVLHEKEPATVAPAAESVASGGTVDEEATPPTEETVAEEDSPLEAEEFWTSKKLFKKKSKKPI